MSTVWKSLSLEIPWKMESTRLWELRDKKTTTISYFHHYIFNLNEQIEHNMPPTVLNQCLCWSNMLLVETNSDIKLNLHRLWLRNILCNYPKMTEYRRRLTADKSLCLYQTCWWQRELQSPHETEKGERPLWERLFALSSWSQAPPYWRPNNAER